jgi:ABC-type transporter Mla subunit MlaD
MDTIMKLASVDKLAPVNMKHAVATAAFVLAAALFAGCATTGYDKAGGTSSSMEKAAQTISKSSTQVDQVMTALSDLVSNPGADLKPQFQKFSSAMSGLESTVKDLNGRVADVQKQGADYFKNWDAELAKIQNEGIRNSSAARKKAVAGQFDAVQTNYNQVKKDLDPFVSDLKDIRTALGTDLTAGGVASVKGIVSNADKRAIPVHKSLDALAKSFNDLGVSLSAAAPPPPSSTPSTSK